MQRSNPLSGHTAIPSDALGKCLPSGRATCTTLSGRPQHRRSPASPLLLCTFLHVLTSFSLSYFATPTIVHCSSRRWSGDSHVDLRRSLETDHLSSEPVPRRQGFRALTGGLHLASMSPQPPPFLSRLAMFPPEAAGPCHSVQIGRRWPPSRTSPCLSRTPSSPTGLAIREKGPEPTAPLSRAATPRLVICRAAAEETCASLTGPATMVNWERHISSGAQIPSTVTINVPRSNSVSSVAGDDGLIRGANHDAAI